MAAEYPPFSDYAEEVRAMLEGADWGGYSIRGDIGVLLREFSIAQVPLSTAGVRLVDGLRLLQLHEPRSLADVYKRLVGDPAERGFTEHLAQDDAEMAYAVIQELAQEQTVEEIHEASYPGLVDLSGKFKKREDGVIVFAFGKFRDAPVAHNRSYLHWMLDKGDFPPDTLQHVRQFLRGSGS